DLTKYLKSSDGFIFDVLIRLQAPITIYGAIIYTNTDGGGNLFLGIDFAGNTYRRLDIKRLYAYIKPREEEYKRKLLKSMKVK
ncbi:hypothetical protein KKC87_03965, partial [Patescibacteria group bacterium]|nr:hypothetical protein [Patescibacteria group bacterium]